MRKRGTGRGITVREKWTEKRLEVREIAPTPPLNKEGFWKKPEAPEITVKKDGGK